MNAVAQTYPAPAALAPKLALVDPADLEDVIHMVYDEGWGGYDRKDLELILNISPASCWKATVAGEVVGSVFMLRTRRVAYVSFFIVRDAHRASGVGLTLGMTALATARRDADAVIIFANKKLVSAYAQRGFTSLGDITRFQFRGDRDTRAANVVETGVSDLSRIERLNELCYHDRRADVVREQLRYEGARCFQHRGAGAEAGGYAFVRKVGLRYLVGPIVARDDDVARELVTAVRAALPDETLIADAPPAAFSRLLEELGVQHEVRKSVEKMYLGDAGLLEADGLLRAIGGHHFG